MSDTSNDEDLPLHDEAQARDKWRDETVVEGGATKGNGRPGKSGPGTIPPPD